jgi:hypothetical protein
VVTLFKEGEVMLTPEKICIVESIPGWKEFCMTEEEKIQHQVDRVNYAIDLWDDFCYRWNFVWDTAASVYQEVMQQPLDPLLVPSEALDAMLESHVEELIKVLEEELETWKENNNEEE